MENIKIRNFGPIKEADINFGDLTFFVGPQASGKSVVLQLVKLITDKTSIETKLENYGFVWGNNLEDNLERFFGEGMDELWDKRTDVNFDGHTYTKNFLAPTIGAGESLNNDKLFYIPAQRVLCLNFGWPRFFKDFDDSVPYVLRDFSETIRQYVEVGFSHGESPIFPQKNHHNDKLDEAFNNSIFHNGKITVDLSSRKRFKLNVDKASLPFMTWSTGQKEFMPLLLGFYWLTRTQFLKRKGVNYVVIEEPEMGLHPEAIKSVILQIMDLVARGYKVIVSTHSPVFLEFAWAFNMLKENGAHSTAFNALFDINENNLFSSFFDEQLIQKKIETYYFDREETRVIVKNISTLDAGSKDTAVAEWGGLSSFSSKASDIISSIVANNG